MGTVQHGIIKPPNEASPGNRMNSCGPMGHGASPAHPPNATIHDGNIANSFLSMTHQGSPMNPPNAGLKFSVSDAQMGQPPSAVAPGKGAIPVNPFTASGNPAMVTAGSAYLRDTAKR